ncbi:IS30 family transposase [Bradyrhizobium sp. SBR1B]|uniref:IS30 family transposase n=1 Tax=Bradyrhizobium sp. SBR1B TaxID=2663836 RepID=UPI003908ABE9
MIRESPAARLSCRDIGTETSSSVLAAGDRHVVECPTRITMLLQLSQLPGMAKPRKKNGPALAGHGPKPCVTRSRAPSSRTIITLPEELRRKPTWDQRAEWLSTTVSRSMRVSKSYFCDPQSPWQRGTNENTNSLLRRYFPKGTDLNIHSAEEISAVAAVLNARPRKTLGWKPPAETPNCHE